MTSDTNFPRLHHKNSSYHNICDFQNSIDVICTLKIMWHLDRFYHYHLGNFEDDSHKFLGSRYIESLRPMSSSNDSTGDCKLK